MRRLILPALMGLLFAAGGEAFAESAWVRFDPARPGEALNPPDTNAWSVVQGFSLQPANANGQIARMGITKAYDKASPLLAGDIAAGTIFDRIELALAFSDSESTELNAVARLILESAQLVDYAVQGLTGDVEKPWEQWTLAFRAVTFMYSRPDEGDGTYSEIDVETGAGSLGDYVPRDPEVAPVIDARLELDPMIAGQFILSWTSDPGVTYDVEFTRDLRNEDFQPISVPVRLGGDGRVSEVLVTDPVGFYRIRER